MNRPPLSGLTVVEVSSGFAAGICGRLLALHGATVTRIESGPDRVDPVTRAWLDDGKATPVAGLSVTSPPEQVRAALNGAYVVLLDLSPATDRGAWDPAALSALDGSLVIASVTPFGETGPWRAYGVDAFTLDALSGLLAIRGDPGRPPPALPPYVMEMYGGLNTYDGLLAACIRRERDDRRRGEIVDVSLLASCCMAAELSAAMYAYPGNVGTRLATRPSIGLGLVQCQDGYCQPYLWGIDNWYTFGALIGDDEFGPLGERFLAGDTTAVELAREKALAWISPRRKLDVFIAGQELRLPFGYVATMDELVKEPQLLARGTLRPFTLGESSVLMPPAPFEVQPAPAGLATPSWRTPDERPLAGVTVVEFSTYWAGPLSCRVLADLGAEVIKVEAPNRPDPIRNQMPKGGVYFEDDKWERGWWNGVNVGKKSLCLDIAQPDGHELVLSVLGEADLVVENFSRRALGNLKLGWSDLQAVNPRASMLSLSAFGRFGPFADYVAFGNSIEPASGVNELTGYPDAPPENLGSHVADPLGGLASAGVALTILYDTLRNGAAARQVELVQREVMMSTVARAFAAYQATGEIPTRNGNEDAKAFPHDCYPCPGEDEWIAISCRTREEWQALCAVVGRTDLAEVNHIGDRQAAVAIEPALRRWCVSRDKITAFKQLQEAGVLAAPVLNARDLYENEQLAARGYFRTIQTAAGFPQKAMTYGFRFVRQPLVLNDRAPRFGEQSDEVLERAGVEPSRIRQARAAGIITNAPTAVFPGVISG